MIKQIFFLDMKSKTKELNTFFDKSGWIGTMGQSEDRDFKVIPTAVSTWGPRIPPAVGTS